MLRLLYRALLRLHPRRFRQRFAGEMLAIFDEAAGKQDGAALLIDGVVSLARQWLWARGPEVWEQPVAAHDAPVFYTAPSAGPSAAALVHGGILSLVTFAAVSYAFEYGRNHPSRMPFGGFLGSGSFERAALRSPATLPFDGVAPLPPVERRPAAAAESVPSRIWEAIRSWGSAPSSAPAESPARVAMRRVIVPVQVPAAQLRRYTGTYFFESSPGLWVRITLERGRLYMEIAGQPKTALAARSETRFVFAGSYGRWIEFEPDAAGEFSQLNVCAPGTCLAARRMR